MDGSKESKTPACLNMLVPVCVSIFMHAPCASVCAL